MAQRTDLYTLLLGYANQRHSSYIDIDRFISFIEKYAQRYAGDRPEWRPWTAAVSLKFRTDLAPLIKAGKCEIINEGKNKRVLIVDFYLEAVNKAYENVEALAEVPFPDEQMLRINVPAEQLRELDVTTDLEEYMKHPQETALPLLKIVFPEELGSALVLASYIPRRILEVSLMKISAFLNPQNNKHYFFSRMTTQFAGKETLLKDILGQIELKPQECLPHIEEGGDFSCFFWPAFCATIRIGLKKKNEFTASDISVLQATFIIEFFSGYYRSITMREKERETALKEIELKIEKAPYAYTLKDILQFTDAVGRPLTDFYTQTDLDGFLNTRAFFGGVPEAGSPLPPLLVFRNRNDEQVFISKGKVFPMLIELLGEVRPQVQKAIESRWDKFIRDFENEAAMENDRDFEKLVTQCAVELAPMLMMILDDKKLFLVQEELTAAQGGALDNSSRVYQDDGTLTPLSKLLSINRKDLLTDVKIQLPFWYNVPIIFSILGFFKRLRDKKPKSQPPRQEVPHEKERARPAKPVQDIKRAAEDYHAQMVPSGKTADAYLQELEDRWRKVIDAAAKKQLVQDVRSQIKHRLKPVLDARGNRKVTSKTIEEMADAVIMVSPAFAKLGNSNDIRAYVALYIAKLLKQ